MSRIGSVSGTGVVQRLGKNIGRYAGETIDITGILGDCVTAARANGWSIENIPAAPKPNLIALTRHPTLDTRHPSRIYLSAGIHGDEPAGPLAVRQLLQENKWPGDLALWLCPCLNPTGFALNRRENDEGLDLNRQYLQPALCLHEDWESPGFYVYELNPDNRPSLAEAIINRVAEVCPIDPSELIEGRPAQGGIIRPIVDPRSRPQWPEAFFLLTRKTRLSYTLEAPSDFPLSTRVAALVAGVRAAIEAVRERTTQSS